ncbi:MAG: translation initiation factor IF-2 subunit gamma [Nanoarchaeota archaeon]
MNKKTEKNEELETINVGIFGHIDHGKTTLLERLSGKWTDTHSEELKRGITIKLGYADIVVYNDAGEYNIEGRGKPARHVSFIDAPGHEMLMATTLSGAALIDAAILIIAANEGIKPQTREHLMVLQVKKIRNIIVIQNKIDLVSIEQARKNYEDIRKFLGESYKDIQIIPVSVQQRVNIGEVLRAISLLPIPRRNTDAEPLFVVARSFDINKPGTIPRELHGAVLGGSLKQGILKVGDEIEIKPGRIVKSGNENKYVPIRTKIRSLYRGSKEVKSFSPGGSMSIESEIDMALGKNDLLAGNVLSYPNKLPSPVSEVKVEYALFPEAHDVENHTSIEKIKQNETLMLSINTSITGGVVSTAKEKELIISLKIPAIIKKGDNVGIARNIKSHWRLIGYGEIV